MMTNLTPILICVIEPQVIDVGDDSEEEDVVVLTSDTISGLKTRYPTLLLYK